MADSNFDKKSKYIRRSNIYITTVLVFVSLAVLTGLTYILVNNLIKERYNADFQRRASEISSLIERKIEFYISLTNGERGLFHASENVESNEWDSFIDALDLQKNYPGVASTYYIERTPNEKNSNNEYYYPIVFVSPKTSDRLSVLGFDVGSVPERKEALEKARDSGNPTATPMVNALGFNKQPAFAVYAPIYDEGYSLDNIDQRRLALAGFVAVSFRIDSLFKDINSDPIFGNDIDIEIYDAPTVEQATSDNLIYDKSIVDIHSKYKDVGEFTSFSKIMVGGRPWTIIFKSFPEYLLYPIAEYISIIIVFVGLLISALLAGLIYFFMSARERAVLLAEDLTKELSASRNELREYIDQMSTFNAKLDLGGNFLMFNKMGVLISGMPEDQLSKVNFLESPWFSEKSKAYVRKEFEKALKNKELVIFNEEGKLPNGEIIYLHISFVPILNELGKVKYIIAEARDVTELKNVANDLQISRLIIEKEKARDEAVLSSIGDGLVIADETGKLVYLNKQAKDILGVFTTGGSSDTWQEEYGIFDPITLKPLPADKMPLSIAMKGKEVKKRELFIRNSVIPNGKFIRVTATPILMKGKSIGGVAVFSDISNEKEIEKMRVDFLALASHQLRTPLSGTKWLIETIQRGVVGKINKKQKEYLEKIHMINERMIKLVVDMLSTLQIEGGAISIKKETISVPKLYNDIITVLEPAAKSNGVILSNKVKDTSDIKIESDSQILNNILSSFIHNAINYSEAGKEVFLDAKDEGRAILFSVKDSGIGIPKEEQQKMFERFYRASNAKTFKPGGTGLGLYIAKMLSDKLGGTVSFESEAGKGSTFYLRLPKKGI